MAVIHREITSIELARFRPHPKWIRGKLDPQKVEEMRASRRVHGQLVPFIAIPGFIIDGNTRAEAMRLDGITRADAILLEHEPTELEVLEIQMAIDVHRSGVPTTVRARTLAAIQEVGGYTVSALAVRVGMTQPWCSQLLAVNKASDAVKAMLNAERIDVEKAAILGANPDPVLVEQAPALSRDQLRQKIKRAGKPAVKTLSVHLPLPGNYMFTLKGPEFDLPTLLEVLQEAMKQCKKAMTNGHDIASISRYLRNTVKAKSAS